MGILGLLLSWTLVIANRCLSVYEDPKIDPVEKLLPQVDVEKCTACGDRVEI